MIASSYDAFMSQGQTRHVRIKPYNPKRGHLMRRYAHVPTNKRFEESHGWYIVDAALAKTLEEVHVHSHDMDSPLAFDVCTAAQAKEIDAREAKAKDRKDASGATDLTTDDLRSRSAISNSTSSPVDERRTARARRTERQSRSMG